MSCIHDTRVIRVSQMNRGLYLFIGADRVRKLQRIHALERDFRVGPLDRHELDGSTVSSSELLLYCRQQPAESLARLIVVEAAHRLDLRTAESLLSHAKEIQFSTCVVLLTEAELAKHHPFLQEGNKLIIEQFAAREQPASKPFALIEALGMRDLSTALQAVQDQLSAGKDPLELVGLVAWQLQRWVLVKRLLGANLSSERLSTLTRMHHWQIDRIRREIAKRPLENLDHLLERCWQLDTDAKSGRTTATLAIEQLVAEVCL